MPQSKFWHRRLLDQMAEPLEIRRAVIARSTRDALRPYLAFRHFFRHTYAFQLDWSEMSPLVKVCERVLSLLEADLDVFIAARAKTADEGESPNNG